MIELYCLPVCFESGDMGFFIVYYTFDGKIIQKNLVRIHFFSR